MTSALLLVACAFLFAATRSQAQNSTDPCKGNEAGALLANATCHIVCNGTDSFSGTNGLNGTKCIISNANQGNKTATYGVCQNNTCMENNAEHQASGSTNGTNSTASSTKAGSTAKPATSSATSNGSTAATQSTTDAPGNVTIPASSGHSPLAAASVLSVALAIGVLLCRAT
nr:mucin-19-like [Rhipicephalus microplus]